MKDIRIGFVGLGQRGHSLIEQIILPQGEKVVAVCDVYEDRLERAAAIVEKAGQKRPTLYQDYTEMLKDEEVNTIIIATAWETHIEFAIAAMKAGKAVAMEVGGAYSLKSCYDLVTTYEETGTPFMFLENCCYGRREMMALNMAQQGVLGEIVHCHGGYHHDLRHEISFGKENRHYRLRNFLSRNCENYPTHELGPIAKILNINHGNRMLTLTAMSSKAAGLHDYIVRNKQDDEKLVQAKFNQGDVVTTVIKCANGETIVLTLDTTLPMYYSRDFTIRGTKGFYEEKTDSVLIDGDGKEDCHSDWLKKCVGNAGEYEEKYDHPMWKEYLNDGVRGGHGGVDMLIFKEFFDALREEKPMPIDVYDAASWMAITALSEMSIARGGAVVDIPDFTNGRWAEELVQ